MEKIKCGVCNEEYPTKINSINWDKLKKLWMCNDCYNVENFLQKVNKNGKLKRSDLSDKDNK